MPTDRQRPVIAEADDALEAWMTALVAPAGVSFAPPAEGPAASSAGVSVHLLSIVSAPPPRGPGRAPIQAKLRYLVTASAPSPRAAHALLDTVLVAALQRADLEVDLDPLPAELWSALRTAPQPAIVLVVPVRQPLPATAAPPVLQPLVVDAVPMGAVEGLVVGNGGVPVAGADIVLSSPRRAARTDHDGRFVLTGVPLDPHPTVLEVQARGRVLTVPVSSFRDTEQPIVITVDLLEA